LEWIISLALKEHGRFPKERKASDLPADLSAEES